MLDELFGVVLLFGKEQAEEVTGAPLAGEEEIDHREFKDHQGKHLDGDEADEPFDDREVALYLVRRFPRHYLKDPVDERQAAKHEYPVDRGQGVVEADGVVAQFEPPVAPEFGIEDFDIGRLAGDDDSDGVAREVDGQERRAQQGPCAMAEAADSGAAHGAKVPPGAVLWRPPN